MKPYLNLSGAAGVVAYEYGRDWIRIGYQHGGTYEYTIKTVGVANFEHLKRLADAGTGLTTFINTHERVKNGFSRKIGDD